MASKGADQSESNPSQAQASEDARAVEYPRWYAADLERLRHAYPYGPTDGDLAHTRVEFHSNLSDFFAQVRYLISLYVALFTLASATIYLALEDGRLKNPWLLVGAGGVLVLAYYLGGYFNNILFQMYDLYVSSVLFSQQLHRIAGKDTHRWFDVVSDRLRTSPESKDTFVLLWSELPDSTYGSYASMMITVRRVALVVGSTLVALALVVFFGSV